MKPRTRNTPTERRCHECGGVGEVSERFTYESVECPECHGWGWIRTAPHDPISNLAKLRRLYRKNPIVFGDRYGEIRQRVVSPVPLPDLRK